MAEDLELPDEVFGFGNWLLWMLATRATALVDAVFEAGPARPARAYGMAEGHPLPTPSLVAWLLTAGEYGVPPSSLTQRSPKLDRRQKVLRTIVSRALNGQPHLFKDVWLRNLAATCGLGGDELQFLLHCRDDEGYAVDPKALRNAVARTLRSDPATSMRVSSPTVATRTLPRDITLFTGREPELLQLLAEANADSAGIFPIHAISGMAGVGKTAFAVHAAHRLAEEFPDGQIFVSLHAHTPTHRPVDPADALASLLVSAGVSAAQVPPDMEARSRLWRSHLTGKRVLLVLDDAADSDQVRPLLPASAGCVALITSRRHLTSLEDARAVNLEVLTEPEACLLIARLAGRPQLSAADPSVIEIARLCEYLPLAIAMLARQLHHHPAREPADLAAKLAAARNRLELLRAENLSVGAAFRMSYADLTEDQQRLFRRLGLHPGTDIDTYAAAVLDDIGQVAAEQHLEALYDQHLVIESASGRYRFHDLIRQYARAMADTEPAAEQDAAVDRLLDYYVHAAQTADRRLTLYTRPDPGELVMCPPSVTAASAQPPVALPELLDRWHALAWIRAERANLLACLDYATKSGWNDRVVTLTAAMTAVLRDGSWADALTRHVTAVQAAQHLGNKLAEAGAMTELGLVQRQTGDYRGSAEALGGALDIYRDLRNEQGQVNALNGIGLARYGTADYQGAAQAHEAALRIAHSIGDRRGQASSFIGLGGTRCQTGDYQGSAEAMENALDIYRILGDQQGQGNALIGVGMVRYPIGDYDGAARALEDALSIYRVLGDQQGQANALIYLGVIRRLTQEFRRAAKALEGALSICRALGDRGAEAEALNETGTLHLVRGDLGQAASLYSQALNLAREIASPRDAASALAGLGRCARADGRIAEARASLMQAHEILHEIGAAEAADIAAELDAPSVAEPPVTGY
jgi:tetratricopeptide (TPR) repeat protein